MIINLKESLKEIDKDTCCEYNLLTMYEACNLSNKEKAVLARMVYEHEDPEVIYDTLTSYFNSDCCDKEELEDCMYEIYDFIEDDGNLLIAKGINESTDDTEYLNLGKTNTKEIISVINNMLNNPKFKLTKKAKEKLYANSAPWGLAVQMVPSVDVDGTNKLLATGDFSGEASFEESTSVPNSKVTIDMWYNDPIDEIYKINMSFSDADLEYRGNLYNKEGKAIGDFTTKDSVALYDAFPQFNWDAYFNESKKMNENFTPAKKSELKKELQDELYTAFINLAKSPEWGYDNVGEIEEFLMPIVDVDDYTEDDTYDIVVEFRGEVNYNELMEVANELNTVVKNYDKNAYFEAIQPGIIRAYIKIV